MKLCKLFTVVLAYFFFDKACGQTPGLFSTKEAVQLKAMLKLSLQQNKQLQAQNNRLKLIWSGIKKLCSSIAPPVPCECDTVRPQKHKTLAEDRHSAHLPKVRDRIKDISPPAVEFYKQDNGNIVNSAIYDTVNEQPTATSAPSPAMKSKNTESFSPIQEVLQDLSIVGFVNKTIDKKTLPSYVHSHDQNDKGTILTPNQNDKVPKKQNDISTMLVHNQNDKSTLPLHNQNEKGTLLPHNQNEIGKILPHNHNDKGTTLLHNQNDNNLLMSKNQIDTGLMLSHNQIDKGLMVDMLDAHTHEKVNSELNQTSHASQDTVDLISEPRIGQDIISPADVYTPVDQGIQYVTGIETLSPNNSNLAPNNLIEGSNSIDTNIILNNLLLATEQSIQQKQMKGLQDRAILKDVKNDKISTLGRGQSKPFISAQSKTKNATDRFHMHDKTRGTTQSQRHRLHRNLKLVIKSVSSEGLERNSISVTVRYIAPYDHTTEWLQLQENGATTRSSGLRAMTNKDSDSEFSNNMVFVDANATKHALFRLFGNNKSISIQFNLTELKVSGEQLLPNFENDINNLRDTVLAPRGSDMEINLELQGSPTNNPELLNTEIFFTGLNTTTRPPTVFEIVHFNSEGVDVLLKSHTKTTSSLKITIKKPYIDYGGILTVRLPQTVGGYLGGYYYGHMIRVLEFYTQEVIPFGHLGVYYLPSTTLVQEPSHSILCAAMGNPPPDVVILKVTPDGVRKETLTETIMLDTVTNMKSLTLYADKPESSEGRYICRASIGSEVVESETEAMVVQRPVFDDILTSVISNNSMSVTVSCKATGKPRPQLEMRLYEEHGPDLAKTGKYKTTLLTPDNDTSQLTLSVSSTDREIHTVYCVAKQNILDNAEETYRKVIVFPRSELYTNWYRYIRLLRMTGG